MITSLGNVARVSLGYKSLQNNFFYVSSSTVETFGIEKKFLFPIFTKKDFESEKFFQDGDTTYGIFFCYEKEGDLQGTGALRYIRAMAGHAAAQKRQSGDFTTIKEALERQGGSRWYAPKARPHKKHIWFRKGIDRTFAPFLFREPAAVDQRYNYIEPSNVDDWVMAALVSSSVFAFSVEIHGSATLGAGALEASTRNLRRFPVLNVDKLSVSQCQKLAELGNEVWAEERPIVWGGAAVPGPRLVKLDQYILDLMGTVVNVSKLHNDLNRACLNRVSVAEDKEKLTNRKKKENIKSEAQAITANASKVFDQKRFPEGFTPSNEETQTVTFPQHGVFTIEMHQILGHARVVVKNSNGEDFWQADMSTIRAEVLIRSALIGRRVFELATSEGTCRDLLEEFFKVFSMFRDRVDRDIEASTIGTRYKADLEAQVFRGVGIDERADMRTLSSQIVVSNQAI